MLGGIVASVVVLAGAYVGALWLLADRVPTGTVVAGVEIGGLDKAAAVRRLTDGLASATTEPIPVAAGDKRTALDPVAAGLRLDAEATVAQVTGFGLEPARLWHQVFGGGALDPVTTVDGAALDGALAQVTAALTTPPVDGTVVFVDQQVRTTAPADGTSVDVSAARQLLVSQWLTAPRPVAAAHHGGHAVDRPGRGGPDGPGGGAPGRDGPGHRPGRRPERRAPGLGAHRGRVVRAEGRHADPPDGRQAAGRRGDGAHHRTC